MQVVPRHVEFVLDNAAIVDRSGRAVNGVALLPLACWDCGFECC
jgi:hypothetical protein